MTHQEPWEEEFDKEFHKIGGWYEKNSPFDCWEAFDGLRSDIKSFIRTAITTALEAKAVEVENIVSFASCNPDHISKSEVVDIIRKP